MGRMVEVDLWGRFSTTTNVNGAGVEMGPSKKSGCWRPLCKSPFSLAVLSLG